MHGLLKAELLRVEIVRDTERQLSVYEGLDEQSRTRAAGRRCDSCGQGASPIMAIARLTNGNSFFVWACDEHIDAIAVALTVREW